MKRKILILLSVLLFVIGAVCYFNFRYVIIHDQIISKSATEVVLRGETLPDLQSLQKLEQLECIDLRGMQIQPEEYDSLQNMLPDCIILWKVPFQNGYYDNSVTELSVSRMDQTEMEQLQYFPNLKTVDAQGCGDYDALLVLRESRPDLTVMYTVDVGDEKLRENSSECTVTNENVKDLLMKLVYLPELCTVNAPDCTDYETLMAIRQARPELDVRYFVSIAGVPHAADATELTLDIEAAQEALDLLCYLPHLTRVTFNGNAMDLELMYQLMCQYPNAVISWDFELFGVATNSTATKLILNDIPMTSTESVENALKYFYNLEWVEMCKCGIPSEEMDALWKRHPETRFVWAISMGSDFIRTDVKAFIPFHYGYDIDRPFHDAQTRELKYLVDMECLDLGHMRMIDISFLEYMPKLRFLILADVLCEDFSSLENLTELVFLELFISEFHDVRLLMNMKKLENLNIAWTYLQNPELLKEMTWLKRLWATNIGMDPDKLHELHEALPNTTVCTTSTHPTQGGWRQTPRYYEMRDMLGMGYME